MDTTFPFRVSDAFPRLFFLILIVQQTGRKLQEIPCCIHANVTNPPYLRRARLCVAPARGRRPDLPAGIFLWSFYKKQRAILWKKENLPPGAPKQSFYKAIISHRMMQKAAPKPGPGKLCPVPGRRPKGKKGANNRLFCKLCERPQQCVVPSEALFSSFFSREKGGEKGGG